MLYSALSVGKKTPKTAPYPWESITLLEEEQATARKFGKDRACGSRGILVDRQTHTE